MTARTELMAIAAEQDGYVTIKDAREMALPPQELKQLARRGKIVREATGVYRFQEFPLGRAAAYRFAVLWTGRTNATLSHDTALNLLELSDINPSKIHVTVSKGERIRRSGGEGIVVHYEDLTKEDLGWWEGIRCVKPYTAIRQAIDTHVPIQLVLQAVTEARSRGMISLDQQTALRKQLEGDR